MFTLADRRVTWMARTLTRSVSALVLDQMVVLLVILATTIGLSVRAGLVGRLWKVAESDDSWLIDACARSFLLVLLSLIGLFALGVMYGNVLGAANVSR